MAFDANLMLHDGTAITGDITPTSTTRSGGSAVLNIFKTAADGITAVLVVQNDLAEASDLLQVTIEDSATANGTYVEMARFPLLTKGTGMPGTYFLRFVSTKAFVRAKVVVVDDDSGGDFTVSGLYVLLTPHFYEIA